MQDDAPGTGTPDGPGRGDGHTPLEHFFREPAGAGTPDTRGPRHVQAEEPLGAGTPLLRARNLTMTGRESTVFGPLDLDLHTNGPTIITGQQGAGRSSLLLALTGRLRGVTGELVALPREGFAEVDGIAHPRALRKATSVARISGFADLEPNLTVGESRDERAIADGLGQRRGRERFREFEDLLGHNFDIDQMVSRLPAVEKTLLTIVLGALAPSHHVVLDDVDEDLTAAQLGFIHDAVTVLQLKDVHYVMTALDESFVPDGATVVHLRAPQRRTAPDFLPTHTFRTSDHTHEDA